MNTEEIRKYVKRTLKEAEFGSTNSDDLYTALYTIDELADKLDALQSVVEAGDRLADAASRVVTLLGPGPTGAATLNLVVQAYRKERAS